MADPIPNPPGGPIKPQPKKETVRINLPPKPSAAPTIKLPTLPPGGPSAGVPGSMQAHAAPMAAAPAAAQPPTKSGAAPVAPPSAQRPAPRPAPAPAAPTLGPLDKILVFVASGAAVVAVLTTYYCFTLFKD